MFAFIALITLSFHLLQGCQYQTFIISSNFTFNQFHIPIGECCLICNEERKKNPEVIGISYYAAHNHCVCITSYRIVRFHGAYKFYLFEWEEDAKQGQITIDDAGQQDAFQQNIGLKVWSHIPVKTKIKFSVLYASNYKDVDLVITDFKENKTVNSLTNTTKLGGSYMIGWYDPMNKAVAERYDVQFKFGDTNGEKALYVFSLQNSQEKTFYMLPTVLPKDKCYLNIQPVLKHLAVNSNNNNSQDINRGMSLSFNLSQPSGCNFTNQKITATIHMDPIIKFTSRESLFVDDADDYLYIKKTMKKEKENSTSTVLRLSHRQEYRFSYELQPRKEFTAIKKTAAIITLLYPSKPNGTLRKQKWVKKIILNYNMDFRDFYIRDDKSGKCLAFSNNTSSLVFNKCSRFRNSQRNILSEDGGCLNFEGGAISLENCSKEHPEASIVRGRFRGHVLDNESFYWDITNEISQFKRVYRKFLSPKESSCKEDIVEMTKIGRFGLTNGYIACLKSSELMDCVKTTMDGVATTITILPRLMRDLINTNPVHGHLFFQDVFQNTNMYSKGGTIKVTQRSFHQEGHESVVTYLRNSTLNEKHYQMSSYYYRIVEQVNTNALVVIWKKPCRCQLEVAQTKLLRMKSCMEIKMYCDEAPSGHYFIANPEIKPDVYNVSCDMETDKGGWLKIAHVEDPIYPDHYHAKMNLTDNLQLAFHYEYKFANVAALKVIANIISMTQIRFFCKRKEKTIHIKTMPTKAGLDVIPVLLKHQGSAKACGSYQLYDDDNSYIARHCQRWGTVLDTWGFPENTILRYSVYSVPFHIQSFKTWLMGKDGRLLCDSVMEDPIYRDNIMTVFFR